MCNGKIFHSVNIVDVRCIRNAAIRSNTKCGHCKVREDLNLMDKEYRRDLEKRTLDHLKVWVVVDATT